VLHASIVLLLVVRDCVRSLWGPVWLLWRLARNAHFCEDVGVLNACSAYKQSLVVDDSNAVATWFCYLVCYAASVAQILSVFHVPYCIPGMAQPAIVLHCQHISTTVAGLGVKACHLVQAGKCNASLVMRKVLHALTPFVGLLESCPAVWGYVFAWPSRLADVTIHCNLWLRPVSLSRVVPPQLWKVASS